MLLAALQKILCRTCTQIVENSLCFLVREEGGNFKHVMNQEKLWVGAKSSPTSTLNGRLETQKKLAMFGYLFQHPTKFPMSLYR